jgi:hypothetical protein
MRVDDDVLQYILRAQSFNESDIAFIMHLMFKDIYRTDSKGQWYSKSDTWILRDEFDIRDLIGSAVCNSAVSCVNAIKNYPHLYKVEIEKTTEHYNIILNNLAEKRQLLRDNNRIDDECIIKEHIQKVIDYRDNIYNKINFNTFDPMSIVRSVHTKSFVNRVMEEAAGLFLGPVS